MASGDTLLIFKPQDAEFPAASYPTPDLRNNHPVLDYATGETAYLSGVMPRHYDGGGVTIYLHYAMTSAVANVIELSTAFERIGDQQQDIDADSFAAVSITGDVTVPATSGLVDIASTAHTNGAQMDSVAVGEGFRLSVARTAPAGTDATGDLELRFVEIKET